MISVCVIVTNSAPPTSKRSSSDLLPHGDPDMIGGFRVAHRCVAGMESSYGLVFTKSSLSPVTGSPQKTDLLLYSHNYWCETKFGGWQS